MGEPEPCFFLLLLSVLLELRHAGVLRPGAYTRSLGCSELRAAQQQNRRQEPLPPSLGGGRRVAESQNPAATYVELHAKLLLPMDAPT